MLTPSKIYAVKTRHPQFQFFQIDTAKTTSLRKTANTKLRKIIGSTARSKSIHCNLSAKSHHHKSTATSQKRSNTTQKPKPPQSLRRRNNTKNLSNPAWRQIRPNPTYKAGTAASTKPNQRLPAFKSAQTQSTVPAFTPTDTAAVINLNGAGNKVPATQF